jgi:D-alanyl-D-alanine carboxypeptidase
VTGTLANLMPNQFISVLDLYYALMLPSGNDAACVLAFYYGGWLVTKKTFLGHQKNTKKEGLAEKMKYYQLYIKKFVQFMNNFIVKQELNHKNTHF